MIKSVKVFLGFIFILSKQVNQKWREFIIVN